MFLKPVSQWKLSVFCNWRELMTFLWIANHGNILAARRSVRVSCTANFHWPTTSDIIPKNERESHILCHQSKACKWALMHTLCIISINTISTVELVIYSHGHHPWVNSLLPGHLYFPTWKRQPSCMLYHNQVPLRGRGNSWICSCTIIIISH